MFRSRFTRWTHQSSLVEGCPHYARILKKSWRELLLAHVKKRAQAPCLGLQAAEPLFQTKRKSNSVHLLNPGFSAELRKRKKLPWRVFRFQDSLGALFFKAEPTIAARVKVIWVKAFPSFFKKMFDLQIWTGILNSLFNYYGQRNVTTISKLCNLVKSLRCLYMPRKLTRV